MVVVGDEGLCVGGGGGEGMSVGVDGFGVFLP